MKFSARATATVATVATVPQPERSRFLPVAPATVATVATVPQPERSRFLPVAPATVATVATPQAVCSNSSDCSNNLAAFSSDSTVDQTCWWNITVAGKRYRVQFEEPQTLAGLREQHTRRRPGVRIELEPVFSPPTLATTATIATVAPDCSHRSDCSGEPNRKTAVDCSHRSDCSKGASGKNEDFVLAGVAVKPNPGDAAQALLAATGVTVEVIREPAAVSAAVAALLAAGGPVGFDIETAKAASYRYALNAGLDPRLSTIRLMQFAADRRAFVFDLATINPALLQPLFAQPLVAHNAVFEWKHCLHAGLDPIRLHCTLLINRVLSGRRRSLAEVAKTVLGWDLDKTLQTSDWSGELTAAQHAYAALDAVTAGRLFPLLRDALKQQDQGDAYKTLAGAQRFIAKLELAGCPFDVDGHRRLIDRWQADAEQGRTQLAAALGPGIDPNSPAHLSAWLERQLDPDTLNRWPRTPKGWLSTGKDTLAAFADLPVVAPLAAYKTAIKRLNTYGEAWLKHRSPATGRIHAGFLIAETKPGRFSCRNPNLQQLPRDAAFRALVKARPGYRLVVADYSQIELRTIALLSGDPTLLAAYRDGKDLHRLTAAAVLGIEPDRVTKGQRQLAKAINFGLIYGMSPATLVSHAKTHYGVAMTLQEAQQAHTAFFRTYPRLRYWQRVTAAETERTLKSPIRGGLVRDFARDGEPYSYTEALNTPVQGAAAMAMLAALPRIDRALVGLDAQPVNLIHDEVVLEVAEPDVPAAKAALSAAMVEGLLAIFPDACTRDLVEAHEGDNWEAAKP